MRRSALLPTHAASYELLWSFGRLILGKRLQVIYHKLPLFRIGLAVIHECARMRFLRVRKPRIERRLVPDPVTRFQCVRIIEAGNASRLPAIDPIEIGTLPRWAAGFCCMTDPAACHELLLCGIKLFRLCRLG